MYLRIRLVANRMQQTNIWNYKTQRAATAVHLEVLYAVDSQEQLMNDWWINDSLDKEIASGV